MANIYVPTEGISPAQADRHFFPRVVHPHIASVRQGEFFQSPGADLALANKLKPWEGLKEAEQMADSLAKIQAQRYMAERKAVGLDHANQTKMALDNLYMEYEKNKGINALNAKEEYDKGVQKVLSEGLKDAPDPFSRMFYAGYTHEYERTYAIKGQGHYNRQQEQTIIDSHKAAIGLAENDMYGARNSAELTIATGNMQKALDDFHDHVGLTGEARDFETLKAFSGIYKNMISQALDKENLSGAQGLLAQYGKSMLNEDRIAAENSIIRQSKIIARQAAARSIARGASAAGDARDPRALRVSEKVRGEIYQQQLVEARKDFQASEDIDSPGPLRWAYLERAEELTEKEIRKIKAKTDAEVRVGLFIEEDFTDYFNSHVFAGDADPVQLYIADVMAGKDTNPGRYNMLDRLMKQVGSEEKLYAAISGTFRSSLFTEQQFEAAVAESETDAHLFLSRLDRGEYNFHRTPEQQKQWVEVVKKARAAVAAPNDDQLKAKDAVLRAGLPDEVVHAMGISPSKRSDEEQILASQGTTYIAELNNQLRAVGITGTESPAVIAIARDAVLAQDKALAGRTATMSQTAASITQIPALITRLQARFGSYDDAKSIATYFANSGEFNPSVARQTEIAKRLFDLGKLSSDTGAVLEREKQEELRRQTALAEQQRRAQEAVDTDDGGLVETMTGGNFGD